MATITASSGKRKISEPTEVTEFLAAYGICYENWAVEGRLAKDATNEEILSEYAAEIELLKQRGGYVTADVINVNPETPNLDQMLAKFDKEHTHSEDEVRFTVEGRGVFWINPGDDDVFSIEVESGDMISVPAGTQHWFHLCDDRHIRCIRLFEDTSGWTPEYTGSDLHEEHPPVCWGNSYIATDSKVKPVVEL